VLKFTPRPSFEVLEDRITPTGFLPDPNFGTGGPVTMGLGSSNASWAQVAVQPDGQIVVFTGYNAGLAAPPDRVTPSYDELLRFNADGSLDTTFGTDGVVQLPEDASPGVMAMAPDGQIYVGTTVNSVATVYRFNPDGTPDTTYGVGGAATVDIGGTSLTVDQLTLTSDGKVVIAGTGGPAWTAEYLVARLNSNGTPDTTFNETGLFSYTFSWWDFAGVSALAVTSGGELILGGTVGWTAPPGPPGTFQSDIAMGGYAALELTSGGTLDTGFNGSGVAIGDPSSPPISTALIEAAGQVNPQNGNIISLGSSVNGLVVYQLNADGTPDTGFGTGGSVTIPYPTGYVPLAGTQSLALLPDGQIVVSVVTATQDWVTVLNADGSGGSTSVPIDFGGQQQYYWNFDGGVAVTPNGQIIVAATRTEDTISDQTQLELEMLIASPVANPGGSGGSVSPSKTTSTGSSSTNGTTQSVAPNVKAPTVGSYTVASPDGKKQVTVVNGPLGGFGIFEGGTLIGHKSGAQVGEALFSANDESLALVVLTKTGWEVIENNNLLGSGYSSVGGFTFSANGSDLAYVASSTVKGTTVNEVVENGKVVYTSSAAIGNLLFDPITNRLTYQANLVAADLPPQTSATGSESIDTEDSLSLLSPIPL
jgi:uncharacterized delta-60 repeat protein